jgi:hypothetical protein
MRCVGSATHEDSPRLSAIPPQPVPDALQIANVSYYLPSDLTSPVCGITK